MISASLVLAAFIVAGEQVLRVVTTTSDRITHFGSDWLAALTAGRLSFEQPGSSTAILDLVHENSPWVGFGHAGLAIPYDSQWVEAYVVLGALGLALTASLFVLLALAIHRLEQGPLHSFGILLTIMLFLAAVGGPALTGNRTASWTWIVVALLTIVGGMGRSPESEASLPSPTAV